MGDTRRGDVEFLKPEPGAFGGDDVPLTDLDASTAAEPPDDRSRGPRWLTAAVIAMVAAIVAVGIVAAAPWDSDDAAPTSTTAGVPDVTAPATAATTTPRSAAGDPSATGYVFDPTPAGFVITTAWTGTSEPLGQRRGWGEVWATPGATRLTGRWSSLVVLPFPSPTTGLIESRVEVGTSIGSLTRSDDGIASLTTPSTRTDGTATFVTVTAYGLSVDEMVAVTIAATAADRIGEVTSSVIPDLLRLVVLTTDSDLVQAYERATPTSVTIYRSGSGDTLQIEGAPEPSRLGAVAPLAGLTSDLVVGGYASGDTVVTIRSTLTDDRLATILPTVRQASIEEWSLTSRRANGESTA